MSKSNYINTALIASLFHRRRPSAIVFGITEVVIATVDRVLARWSNAHVGQEALEIVPDRFAAAVASTFPANRSSRRIAFSGQNHEPSVSLSCAINHLWYGSII